MDVTKMSPQQIANEKQKMIAEKLYVAFREEPFPVAIPEQWFIVADIAIDEGTAGRAGIDWRDWADVINYNQDNVKMFEFGIITNMIEDLPFGKTGLTREMYRHLVNEIKDLVANHYNRRKSELQAEIVAVVNTQMAVIIQQGSSANGVNGKLRNLDGNKDPEQN